MDSPNKLQKYKKLHKYKSTHIAGIFRATDSIFCMEGHMYCPIKLQSTKVQKYKTEKYKNTKIQKRMKCKKIQKCEKT